MRKLLLGVIFSILCISLVSAIDIGYVVNNPLNLNADETVVKNILVGEGFVVNLLEDSYLGNPEDYALLIVGADIWDSTDVFNNKNYKTIFLGGNAAKKAGLGYSSGSTSPTNKIDVVYIDTDITDDFSLGELVVYSQSTNLNFLGGCVAKNAEILGETHGESMLVKYNTDALLLDGSCSRRNIILNERNLYFGFSEASLWNQNSEDLFLNSVNWILSGGDSDGDGVVYEDDCDDDDATKWQMLPGYVDWDGDVFGSGILLDVCSGDELNNGFVDNDEDCDDTRDDVNPDALEIPYDGVDNDCSAGDLVDVDEDGYDAEVVGGSDCDDDDETLYQNINGYVDLDEDGFGGGDLISVCSGNEIGEEYVLISGDCDDTRDDVNPDAEEILDDVDQNCVNDAPFFSGNIEDIEWDEDTDLVDELNLDDYFSDYEGDDLSYWVYDTSIDDYIQTVINDNLVSFYSDENWNGWDWGIFNATDGEFSVNSNNVSLTVLGVNDAPVLDEILDVSVIEGGVVDINPSASDIDNDLGDLSFSFTSPLDSNGEWQTGDDDAGIYDVVVIVSDGSLEDSQVVKVTVVDKIVINEFESDSGVGSEWVELYNPNGDLVDLNGWRIDSETFGTIYTFTTEVLAGHEFLVVDVNNIFNSGDKLSLVSSSDSVIDETPVLIDSFFDSKTWQRVPNGFDSDSISDWKFQEATKGIDNEEDVVAPVVTLISPADLSEVKSDSVEFKFRVEDDLATSLECVLYSNINRGFVEIDNAVSPESMPNGTVGVFTISGIVDGDYEWNVECDDGTNSGFAEDNYRLTVDDKPEFVNDIPDKVWNEDNNIEINLSQYFVDEDAVIVYSVSDLNNLVVNINGEIASVVPDLNWFGVESVVFSGCDGSNCVDSNSVELEVLSVNDAPVLDSVADVTILEGEVVQIDVSANDVDSSDLFYSFTSPLNNSGYWQTGFDDAGVYDVVVIVSDGNLEDSQIFRVTVEDTNEPPYLDVIPDILILEDSGFTDGFVLNAIDNDGVVVSYGVVSENVEEVDCSISGNVLGVEPVDDWFGTGNCVVQAVDDDGATDSETVNVIVTNVNDAPVIDSFVPDFNPKIGDNETMMFSVVYHDVDEDDLNVEWYINNVFSGSTGDEFNLRLTNPDLYEIKVMVKDFSMSDEYVWSVVVSDIPLTDKYGGETTDFSGMDDDDLQSVNLVLEKEGVGKIEFLEPVDMRSVVDLDRYTEVLLSFVGIDSNVYNIFKNKLAKITLYGLSFDKTPTIYYDNIYNLDSSSNSVCSDSVCSNVNFDGSSGKLEFETRGFSSFIVGDTLSCTQKGGFVFGVNEVCKGNLIDAKDTVNCCSVRGVPGFSDIETCGVSNNNIKIDIDEPDDGDEFMIGDVIEGSVEIKNKLNEDLDFDVEIILYDLENDEEIDVVDESIGIDEGDKEEIEFKFDVDSDFEDGDDYYIYVKVVDDENESLCSEEFVNIEIQKEKFDLKIKEFEVLDDNIVCGDDVEVKYRLENIGKDDLEDVMIKVFNGDKELGRSEEFDVDEGDDVDKIVEFNIEFADGDYEIETEILFEDEVVRRSDVINVECRQQEVSVFVEETTKLSGGEKKVVSRKYSDKEKIIMFDVFLIFWIILIFILILIYAGRKDKRKMIVKKENKDEKERKKVMEAVRK